MYLPRRGDVVAVVVGGDVLANVDADDVAWIVSVVADVGGDDDRFPAMVCDVSADVVVAVVPSSCAAPDLMDVPLP